ncbi:MAG: hypothetical protein EU981_01600 [Candidatus Liberibacter ctenarytainae]|uniref:Peptidoglycan binding protein n=1 Tax=Candidatus Liberibacter ctenarytainae TaxID=2020335 RepID=A0A937DLT9_9HYPH|nr:hypothetical protein [Candidatus Liberibacter ctenarytainae]
MIICANIIKKVKQDTMSGLQKHKPHSNDDAVSTNSKAENTSNVADIKRIISWIEQINEQDPLQSLSSEQKKKIQFLLTSLEGLSNNTPHVNNFRINLSPHKMKDRIDDKKSYDLKEMIFALNKKLSHPSIQGKIPHGINILPQKNLKKEINSVPKRDALYPKNNSPCSDVEKHDDLHIFNHDMAILAKSISELCRIMSISGIQGSRASLEKILSKMDTLAKECSLHKIENGWLDTKQCFKELNVTNLLEKITSLSGQIDMIKSNFDKKSKNASESDLDKKIFSILNNTNNLLSIIKPMDTRISQKQISTIDETLSNIKESIKNNGRSIEEGNTNLFQRIEEKIDITTEQIHNIHDDVIHQKRTTDQSLKSLELLDKRLKTLENFAPLTKIQENFSTLSQKFSDFLQISDNKVLSGKLDSISQSLGESQQFNFQQSFQKLEDHLKSIILQVEKAQYAPKESTLLKNIEIQISHIKDLVINNIPSNQASQKVGNNTVKLEDYIVDTAQKTAQLMRNSPDERQELEKVLKNSMLEYFEERQQIHAQQTIKNFTTIYEMLVNISKKLEKSTSNNCTKSSLHSEDSCFENIPRKPSLHIETLSDTTQVTESPHIDKKKQEEGKYPLKNQHSIFDLNNSMPAESHQPDGSSPERDESENNVQRAMKEDMPHNIQQILDRVSSIQDGVWEDYNTIPAYISAARRAASASTEGSGLLAQQSEKTQKKQWPFIKKFSIKSWFTSIMLAAILITSTFLISPSYGIKKLLPGMNNLPLSLPIGEIHN